MYLEEEGEERHLEKLLPLTCLKGIEAVFGENIKCWPKILKENYKKVLNSETFLKNLINGQICKIFLETKKECIVLYYNETKKILKLLLDTSRIKNAKKFVDDKATCLILGKNEILYQNINDFSQIPFNWKKPKCLNKITKDLSEILGVKITYEKSKCKNPQTLSTLKTWVNNYNVQIPFKIYYVTKWFPLKYYVWYYKKETRNDYPAQIKILAYTNKKGKVCYCKKTTFDNNRKINNGHVNFLKKEKNNNKIKNFIQHQKEKATDENLSELFEAEIYKKNRSCGVSVPVFGLTKAFLLGCINLKEELLMLTKSLSFCNGTLWVHFDSEKNTRHVCYADSVDFLNEKKSIFFKHVFFKRAKKTDGNYNHCTRENQKNWQDFFEVIFNRHEIIGKAKNNITKDILLLLEKKTTQKNNCNFKKCLRFLKDNLKKTKILVFSREDFVLHTLKEPFIHFLNIYKKSKNSKCKTYISPQSNSKNYLVRLASSELIFENSYVLFDNEGTTINFYDDLTDLLDLCDTGRLSNNVEQNKYYRLETNNLLPCPLIDANIADIENCKEEWPYSPGKIIFSSQGNINLHYYILLRSEAILTVLLFLYHTWSIDICKYCNLDINTAGCNNFSNLAMKCVWLKYVDLGGQFCQSNEKIKKMYDFILRKHCRGGFSFSNNESIKKDDALFPKNSNSEKAKTVVEYDLTSSYGSAASEMACPTGFAVGFLDYDKTENTFYNMNSMKEKHKVKNNNGWQQKLETFDRLRCNGWEFLATYAAIFYYSLNYKIKTVLHNYSPLGSFMLDNYIIDLTIFTECNKIFFIQFDSQFTHGCAKNCTALNQYAGECTEIELKEKTEIRDTVINDYVNTINAQLNCETYKFIIYTDCHDDLYKIKNLRTLFDTDEQLKKLVQPYKFLQRKKTISINELQHLDKDLTYLLLGQGHSNLFDSAKKTPTSSLQFSKRYGGSLFTWIDEKNQGLANSTVFDTLFTRDSLEYYQKHHNFILTSASFILIYRKCTILPQVYSELLNMRVEAKKVDNILFVKTIKRIINYSCGYFGLNPNKAQKMSYKIYPANRRRNILENNYNLSNTSFTWDDQEYHMYTNRKQRVKHKNNDFDCKYNHYVAGKYSLPIFASVIEYGKKRLHECLFYLHLLTRPTAIKFMYSNVDNLIFVLSEYELEDTFKTTLQHPNKQNAVKIVKDSFLNQNEPGKLKYEWNLVKDIANFDHQWVYASHMTCFYVAGFLETTGDDTTLNNDGGHGKCSSLKNLSFQEMYRHYQNMKQDGVSIVSQKRRINKMLNMDCEIKKMKFVK